MSETPSFNKSLKQASLAEPKSSKKSPSFQKVQKTQTRPVHHKRVTIKKIIGKSPLCVDNECDKI